MSKVIADLLFPDSPSIQTIQDIIPGFKERENTPIVTRIAPSPTGFLHIGTLYTSLLNQKLAHQAGGKFILRVEDTDQARNTTDFETQSGWIYSIVRWLKLFGIPYDEGMREKEDKTLESFGDYGPYIQSERLAIYNAFIKYLVESDKAYVCFLTPEQLENIRTSQQLEKKATGIYGAYAMSRNLTEDEIISRINNGEKRVIRLRCESNPGEKVSFGDGIKGNVEMETNYIDQVLLKGDGFPSFALAHIIDDYLMGTTHVIRSDEWLASIPFHMQVFRCFEQIFTRPMRLYCHISPIQKLENGNRRKISKRKDPESDVLILHGSWYPAEWIKVFMFNLLNSNFEDWWKETNSSADVYVSWSEFQVSLEKCSTSGAILDITKLNHMCSEYLAWIDMETLFDDLKEFYNHTQQVWIDRDAHSDYIKSILSFDRNKKSHITYQNIIDYILPFLSDKIEIDTSLYPEAFDTTFVNTFSERYSDYISNQLFDTQWNIIRSKEEWFEDLKAIGKDFKIAGSNWEFKEGWYIGKIGDLAMVLRVKLYWSANTPDIYEMIRVMGKERAIWRLKN